MRGQSPGAWPRRLWRMRFAQRWIHADALVEHEAVALVMSAAALFEILQDPAFELKNILESLAFQKRRGLLASNAARAEHHDRLTLQRRQSRHRVGKVPKPADAGHDCSAERTALHLVIISRVEQHNRSRLVEPLLQHPGGKFRRGLPGRIDTSN